MSVNELLDLIKNLPVADGWGPSPAADNLLNGVPYMPFSKADKLSRMADWTDSKDRNRGQFGRGREQQSYGVGAPSNPFAVAGLEEESTFSVVDNARTSKTTRGFGRGGGTVSFRARGGRGGAGTQRGGRAGFQRVGGRGGYNQGGDRNNRGPRNNRRFGWRDDKPQRNRDSTVNVQPSWVLAEEMDFLRLSKLNLEVDGGENIESEDYGMVHPYDRDYDKNFGLPAGEKKLQVIERAAYNITTSSDPVIQELSKNASGVAIYATDSILSMLMCAPRSVQPWDVVITRQGNKLFIDKREESNLDHVTVNENAYDSPQDYADNKDPINNQAALTMEATHINTIFPLQVVKESGSKHATHKNHFYNEATETDALASKIYRYRTFDLSLDKDEDAVELIVRTELDALIQGPEEQYATIKALNEFPGNVTGTAVLDWRRKLATNRGAVVATEMKNNSCKLARWTTQALLADAHILKLGFVARASPKNNDEHVVLGVFGSKPRDFARQMNLSMANGWGIVRTVVDLCLKHSDSEEETKFVLMKDPNAAILRLYKVPENAFDEEEPVVEEEEEEE